MVKSTNTKWFTLVELIIVITILAILATIAFISFQGYSKDARDASKQSEIANVVKVIAAEEAKNEISPLNYINGTPGTATVGNIQGLTNVSTATGKLNTQLLGFTNSRYAWDFEIAVYTGGLNVYQIRAKMENTAENGDYFTSGTYSPRNGVSLSGSIVSGKLVLTDGIGLAKMGDRIGADDSFTVKGISSDLTTITLSGATTFTTYPYVESSSLFGN